MIVACVPVLLVVWLAACVGFLTLWAILLPWSRRRSGYYGEVRGRGNVADRGARRRSGRR